MIKLVPFVWVAGVLVKSHMRLVGHMFDMPDLSIYLTLLLFHSLPLYTYISLSISLLYLSLLLYLSPSLPLHPSLTLSLTSLSFSTSLIPSLHTHL